MGTETNTAANGGKGDTAGAAWSEAEYVMDYRVLRVLIGLIAILLVPVVYIGNWFFFTRHVGGCLPPNPRIPGSLSGFYYTHMRNIFVGAMCAIGVFLVAYRGHDRWDNRLTNVAGLAAVCIAVFPTAAPYYSAAPGGPNQFFASSNLCGPTTLMPFHQIPHQGIARYVHLGSLFVLFVMVFLMVLVQFTRTDQPAGKQSWMAGMFAVKQPMKFRNQACVACAAGIAVCGLLALIAAIGPSSWKTVPWLLFSESGAFLFFGFAWLVKGAVSASATQNDEQRLVRALSRTVPKRLKGDPHAEPADASVPATAGEA